MFIICKAMTKQVNKFEIIDEKEMKIPETTTLTVQ